MPPAPFGLCAYYKSCTLPGGLRSKESTCQRTRHRWVLGRGSSPGGRNGNPTPVVLPGECHGQRSLVGYSPWSRRELDTTARLSTHSQVAWVAWAPREDTEAKTQSLISYNLHLAGKTRLCHCLYVKIMSKKKLI